MNHQLVLKGTGSYLPERVMDNHEMSKLVDTNDEWIVERTGIHKRHLAAEGETTATLATEAAKKAIAKAGLEATDIDLIIMATTTPDNTFPSTACKLQAALGNHHAAAFDVQAVCSGFIYALSVAEGMAKTGHYNHVLIVGAETLTRIVDWQDRGTCILFGDGAGAMVFSCEDTTDNGLLGTRLYADGATRDLLYVDGGVSTTQSAGLLRMEGREVFKHAVVKLAEATNATLENTGLTADDVDWVIPHQANQRILDATMKKLKLPSDKLISTVGEHANTSAASIPLAIDAAVADGRIKDGNLLSLQAIGGGLTWGAALIRI